MNEEYSVSGKRLFGKLKRRQRSPGSTSDTELPKKRGSPAVSKAALRQSRAPIGRGVLVVSAPASNGIPASKASSPASSSGSNDSNGSSPSADSGSPASDSIGTSPASVSTGIPRYVCV